MIQSFSNWRAVSQPNCCTNCYGCLFVFCLCFPMCVIAHLHVHLPQRQRGQQSWVSQRNAVPSGQDGVSITEQLTFVAEMNNSSFTLTHWCNTHFSCGDCHISPTYKQTEMRLKSTKREEWLHWQYTFVIFLYIQPEIYCLSRVIVILKNTLSCIYNSAHSTVAGETLYLSKPVPNQWGLTCRTLQCVSATDNYGKRVIT